MSQNDVGSHVTAARLSAALAGVSTASTAQAISVALVSAATQLQDAVLAGQSSESIYTVLDSLDQTAVAAHLHKTLARAANFHLLADGSTLGFWLLPVVIDHPAAIAATIDLRVDSLQLLRASADLAKQMGLLGQAQGWVMAAPRLISATAMQQADLTTIIRFPHQAHRVVQGLAPWVNFSVDQACAAESGLYYLPLVTKHPASSAITQPQPDAAVSARIEAWVHESLATQAPVRIPTCPKPFADAMDAGARFMRSKTFDRLIGDVVADMGVAPHGLTVLLAAYHTETESGNCQEYIGCTISSKLTGAVLSTAAIPVITQARQYLEEAQEFLIDLGVASVQILQGPRTAVTCHHCGELQLALPHSVPLTEAHATGPTH